MAQSKTQKKKADKQNDRQKITAAYKEFVLTEGKKPPSVFKFMNDLKMQEAVFYDYFGSFEALERSVWKDYGLMAIESVKSDEVYDSFSSREKLLSFYYTLLEVLKTDRSFVSNTVEMPSKGEVTPQVMRGFREVFMEYVQEVINEGRETEEIKDRKYISDRYKDGLWLQTMFIINFWLKDDSEKFEKTDAAIEKAVNLAYDLMGTGPLDKMFDFAKFLYQNRV